MYVLSPPICRYIQANLQFEFSLCVVIVDVAVCPLWANRKGPLKNPPTRFIRDVLFVFHS